MTLATSIRASQPDEERHSGRFDVQRVRDDFPILKRRIRGRPLVYLDSAASAQKPKAVLDAMQVAQETIYANVHRGVHTLSQEATAAFEAARGKLQAFINAASAEEIIFVRGATEGINLIAASYGRTFLSAGDEIILSELEHHSNIVPWQMLRAEKGIVLKVAPIDDDGNFLLPAFERLLSERTRLVAVTHVSNALGTVTPAQAIIAAAHRAGAKVLLDGCQAVPHLPVDVQALDVDFYVFSGHKMYGPTGIGVLYGKKALLAAMPPYQGGGEMIRTVSFAKTEFKEPPQRFEAGTPAIVEAIGLGAAADYLVSLDRAAVRAHETALLGYATERLRALPGLRIVGQAAEKAAIVSFVMEGAHPHAMEGAHPHDIGTILDRAGIAIRAGHHCAQPLMDRLGLAATARASFGLYNTRDDVDALVEALKLVREIFA